MATDPHYYFVFAIKLFFVNRKWYLRMFLRNLVPVMTVYYHILKTTFYEGDPAEITGLHTEALGVLFPVDSMDSCEEMMIQDWYGALYKKDDTAYLCWTYSPEVTYVLEYTPSKIDDSEIIKMAESAEEME